MSGKAFVDSNILVYAHDVSAETLSTEDLNAGQSYGSVRAVNPFT